MKGQSLRTNLFSILCISLASVVYAISFCWCYDPNQIGFGGLTGIAQIINSAFPQITIGTLIIALNIPLFLLGWKLLGRRFLLLSLYTIVLCSLLIDAINYIYTFPPMDPILACVFGGVLLGVSLGIIFLNGTTAGGTGLVSRLLKVRYPWLPMGKLLLAIDIVVVIAVALAFHNLSSALYGMMSLYISAVVTDGVLYGLNYAKVAYIISDRHAEIGNAIIHVVARGATILHGEGVYSGSEKQVLMVAFKQRQIIDIKRIVKEIDPNAFLIVCEAHEVLGDGFRVYKESDV